MNKLLKAAFESNWPGVEFKTRVSQDDGMFL